MLNDGAIPSSCHYLNQRHQCPVNRESLRRAAHQSFEHIEESYVMNITQEPRSDSPRVQPFGPSHSSTLIVLDGGLTHDHTSWSRIISSFQDSARLLVIERTHYSLQPDVDLAGESNAIRSAIDQHVQHAGSVRSRILVGIAAGNLIVQSALSRFATMASDLILIDPPPLPTSQLETRISESWRNWSFSDQIDLPVTVILPGTSTATSYDENVGNRELQAQDLERFPNRREIIAGRSRENILLERPDVVIDAIQRMIEPQHPHD
jgi:hypothetical protein